MAAFILTYQTLFSTILSYLERDDEDVKINIPVFIALAQRRIAKDTETLGLQVYVTGNFTPGLGVIPKPARWKNSLTFNYGTGDGFNTINQIYLRGYEYCQEYWPNRTEIGLPKYYSDYAFEHLLIVPTPDLAYPFEFGFFEFPQSIDSSNQTNWVTANAPELLIYGCLLEAMIFLKDDDRIQFYKQFYIEALVPFINEDKARLTDRYSKREG